MSRASERRHHGPTTLQCLAPPPFAIVLRRFVLIDSQKRTDAMNGEETEGRSR